MIDDVTRRTPIAFAEEGQLLYLLGDTARGVRRLGLVRRSSTTTSAGCRRRWTWSGEQLLAEILISASRDGMIDAAHDLSDGGLIQAVTESCLRGGKGARLVVPGRAGRRSPSCSRESAGRAVVAVPRSEELRFTDMCGARGLPAPGSVWSTARRSRSRASSPSR